MGPRPVFWTGTVTLQEATAQAQATADTLLASSMSLISVREVLLGEGKAHLPPDVRQEFLQSWAVFQMPPNGLAPWCSCPSAPQPSQERHVGLLHPLGAHIVCSLNEACWLIIQKLDDPKEVVGFPGHPVFPGQHGSASGIAMQGLKMMPL